MARRPEGQAVTGGREPDLDRAAVAAAISEQIAAIYVGVYDMPVKHVTTYVLEDLVVSLLDIDLTLIEQRMIEYGRAALVHELRHAAQEAGAASLAAVVERATGRRVVAFSSHTNLGPPFVAELFRLGPSTARPAEPE